MSNYNSYELVFPKNLEKYSNLKGLAIQFENSFKKNIISKVTKLALIKNIELQDDNILNELASQFCIENWDKNKSKEIKINLIKNAYWAHAKKGTKATVLNSMSRLNYNLKIQEWWEYGGAPYTFRINVNKGYTNKNWVNEIIEAINNVKNTRSILEHILVYIEKEKSTYNIKAYKTVSINKTIIKVPGNKIINPKLNIKAYRTLIIGGKHEI